MASRLLRPVDVNWAKASSVVGLELDSHEATAERRMKDRIIAIMMSCGRWAAPSATRSSYPDEKWSGLGSNCAHYHQAVQQQWRPQAITSQGPTPHSPNHRNTQHPQCLAHLGIFPLYTHIPNNTPYKTVKSVLCV